MNINDFFAQSSKDVARLLIGMEIVRKDVEGIYVVSKTKAYLGDTRHTANMPRMYHGSIMMFNMRGHPHFCIATGDGPNQDYTFINSLIGEGQVPFREASEAARALGLDLSYNGRKFADYFRLRGETQESLLTRPKTEAPSCKGVYELIR